MTWDMTNIKGEIVFEDGSYDNTFTSYIESYCVNEGYYRLTIRDSASDGFCCDWFKGNVTYELSLDSIQFKGEIFK